MVRSENNQNPEKNVTSPSPPKSVFSIFHEIFKIPTRFFPVEVRERSEPDALRRCPWYWVLIPLAQRLYFSLALLVFLLGAPFWFEAVLHHWLHRCQLTIWRKGHCYPREWYRSMSMNLSLKNMGYSSALGVGISPDLPHNFSASRSFCSQWFETQSSWSVGWCYPI